MASSSSIASSPNYNATLKGYSPEFRKLMLELQATKNPLEDLFESNETLAIEQRFKVQASFEADQVADVNEAFRDTVDMETSDIRSVRTEVEAFEIHQSVARVHAQRLNMSISEYKEYVMKNSMYAMKRAETKRMLNLMVKSYWEDDIISSGGASLGGPAVLVHLAPAQRVISKAISLGGGLYSVPFDIKMLIELESRINSDAGITQKDGALAGYSLNGVNTVLLISTKGLAQLQLSNIEFLHNKDYFGRDLFTTGYGKVHRMGSTMVVEVNDNAFFATGTTGATVNIDASADIAFALPANLTRRVNEMPTAIAAGIYENANHSKVDGLYRAVLINRGAFKYYIPKQKQVLPHSYKDKDHSFEEAIHAIDETQGVRVYHDQVYDIYFSGDNDAIITTP